MKHLLRILAALLASCFICTICYAYDKDGYSIYIIQNEERYTNYSKAYNDLPYDKVVLYVNIGLDRPFYTDIKTVDNPDSVLVLLNKYNKLPDGFLPEGFSKNDTRVLKFRADVQAEFERMQTDAKKEGIKIFIVSGYRSCSVQNDLYNARKKNGADYADNTTARPGHSEHHTGLTSDFNTTSFDAHFENTNEYKWLMDNAHNYGFILRYPEGKKWITGYNFEPWHWRYVGIGAAKIIKEKSITFEEYIALYETN